MPAVVAILLFFGAFFGAASSSETAKNAAAMIATTANAPGIAAMGVQDARAKELANNYQQKVYDAQAAVMQSDTITGKISSLMQEDYDSQIQTKRLEAAKALQTFEVYSQTSKINLTALQKDADNKVQLALDETQRSIWFGRVGSICAIILVPFFVAWFSLILLRFIDGMSQAAVRKAKGGVEMIAVNDGLLWNILRFVTVVSEAKGILPRFAVPPRLYITRNELGGAAWIAIDSAGKIVPGQDGPTGLQVLGAKTARDLAMIAVKARADSQKSLAHAFMWFILGRSAKETLYALRGQPAPASTTDSSLALSVLDELPGSNGRGGGQDPYAQILLSAGTVSQMLGFGPKN